MKRRRQFTTTTLGTTNRRQHLATTSHANAPNRQNLGMCNHDANANTATMDGTGSA